MEEEVESSLFPYCETNDITSSQCNSFYLTRTPVVVAMVASPLSIALCSLVIVIIFRSQIRLCSVYHRITFPMISLNIIASLSSSLTTVPMPKDTIYPFQWGLGFHGTVVTCEIQAFLYIFANYGSNLYFCGLTVFYVSIIYFRISDKKIRRYIEPFIHLFGFVLPLSMVVSI